MLPLQLIEEFGVFQQGAQLSADRLGQADVFATEDLVSSIKDEEDAKSFLFCDERHGQKGPPVICTDRAGGPSVVFQKVG